MDNYAARNRIEVRAWLANNPRPHVHFTPASVSWLNLVEVRFAIIERQRSIAAPSAISPVRYERSSPGWNKRAHPFVWTKTADEILKKANR